MNTLQVLCDEFTAKAEAVSAVVAPVQTLTQALAYTVDLCDRKEACELLAAGCETSLSNKAETLCRQKQQKVMAAPGLEGEAWQALQRLCKDKDILLTADSPDSLRGHLAGIDVGFTLADYGIAETGSLVINSSSEAVRLATMISEVHVAVLPVSKIRPTVELMEAELRDFMATAPNYLAFITGPSRTADIERVLAIGVHGPLELHILMWEDR